MPGVHVWHDYSPDGRNESQYLSGLHNDLAMVLWRAPLPILLPALIWRAHQQFRLARKINCAHVLPKVVLDFCARRAAKLRAADESVLSAPLALECNERKLLLMPVTFMTAVRFTLKFACQTMTDIR